LAMAAAEKFCKTSVYPPPIGISNGTGESAWALARRILTINGISTIARIRLINTPFTDTRGIILLFVMLMDFTIVFLNIDEGIGIFEAKNGLFSPRFLVCIVSIGLFYLENVG
jgi:hypothetical protein